MGSLENIESESLPIKEGCMSVPVGLRKEPLTLTLSRRSRKIQASLSKGGDTEVPEGLRKFTLTRIAKFTKFIKQFNPLTKREGKELGHPEFVSGTYTVLTPYPSPLPLRERKNQAFLGKGGGTEVPEGLWKTTLTRLRHHLPEVEGKEFENDRK